MNAHFNILVADDSRIMRSIIKNMVLLTLEGRPVKVDFFEAPTGIEAIKQLGKAGIDLLFLDLTMPGLDGLDVLRQIRSNPKTCAIKVAIVTSDRKRTRVFDAINLGANDYFIKPFDEPLFRRKLLDLLESVPASPT
jgi:two-component system chemotaxis response regulator CheY